MTIWFISDTHFGHANVIRYSNRPFLTADEMDESLIKSWNEKVKPSDTIYHLGDFSFSDATRTGEIIDRLNGQKFLIYGNHDKTIKNQAKLRDKFVKCCDYLEISISDPDAAVGRGQAPGTGKQHLVLCHYAMLSWNRSHYGAIMLHGHSHGSLRYPFEARMMDVGVDPNGYAPVSYEEIKQKLAKVVTESLDHH